MGLGRLIRACRRMPNPRAQWGFPIADSDHSGRTFAVRRLGPDRLAYLKEYARQQHVTLNDVLLTAFYRALVVIIDPSPGIPVAIQNTTSLRRYRPAGDAAICNLVSIFYQSMPHVPDEPFAATLTRVHVAQQAKLQDDSWLAAIVLAELLFACGYAVGSRVMRLASAQEIRHGTAAPIYANLGAIAPETADFGGVGVENVTVHGPAAYSPLVILTINTFGGTMNFTASGGGGSATAQQLERLLDLCVKELSLLGGNGRACPDGAA